MAVKLFVIAGHGAGDPGATGGGETEANLVRKLASKIKELGGSSVEVLDTSRNWYADGGVNASLKKKVGANPLIELHMDAASSSAKGGHVIIKSGMNADGYDKALAAFLKKEFPGRSETIVKRSNLANVSRSAAQGINYRLIEVCFITNASDRNKFINSMEDIAKGILSAFGIPASGKLTFRRILRVKTYLRSSMKKVSTNHLKTLKKGACLEIGSVKKGTSHWWGGLADGSGYINLGSVKTGIKYILPCAKYLRSSMKYVSTNHIKTLAKGETVTLSRIVKGSNHWWGELADGSGWILLS